MVNKMQNFWMYLLVVVVTCLTPGAGVLMTLNNALRYGKANAFVSPLGNAFGGLTMAVICATGLGALIAATPELFIGLQFFGAAMLVYFGLRSWRAKSLDLSRLASGNGRRPHCERSIFWSAATLQLTNPMLLGFLLSLMPPFLDPEADYASSMAMLIAVFVVICLVVHLGYSYIACCASRYLKGERFGWWMNHVSAVLFWVIAAGVVTELLEKI